MHRNDKIKMALETLKAIETAVAEDSGGMPLPEHFLRVDNAVRIYCADEIARATYYKAPA